MENRLAAIEILKQKIEGKIGRSLHSPTDFNLLSLAIRQSTNESISQSTIKRIWNYIPTEHTTRDSTLSVFARYLGYKGWGDFCDKTLYSEDESSFLSDTQILTKELEEGEQIELEWEPNRFCVLLYVGHNRFRVINERNTKLNAGDTFETHFLGLGHPLYVAELYQSDGGPKYYVAGSKKGLKRISLIKTNPEIGLTRIDPR